ncbi:MAG: hypothetical protein MUF23_13830 [Pirellula sp.]|jgi:type II secretory pathway component PulJ|nr:hypothetical protein [Pirellula sp.]
MTKRRAGSTLIELIMTVSAGTVLMLLAVTLIHQSMTWSQIMGTRNRDQQSMQRLAEAWREDCRNGLAIEVIRENLSAVRLSDQRRVEYEVRPGVVLRRDISEIGQEKQASSNEQFAFSPTSRFRVEQMDAPKRARLSWLQQIGTRAEPAIVCIVDGVLEGELRDGGDQ